MLVGSVAKAARVCRESFNSTVWKEVDFEASDRIHYTGLQVCVVPFLFLSLSHVADCGRLHSLQSRMEDSNFQYHLFLIRRCKDRISVPCTQRFEQLVQDTYRNVDNSAPASPVVGEWGLLTQSIGPRVFAWARIVRVGSAGPARLSRADPSLRYTLAGVQRGDWDVLRIRGGTGQPLLVGVLQ
ncbi:hypothetical protein N657DRAFT_379152 [Parathielavia appendiculata]|uniref:Uncharacterized protein n=1 Tax=Parathielavia appendiculata TaxID=2587402 RepID=A0AAN6U0X7_9PEZI|nr:hypothetical protein N657DRAFT_379152 [Parathielavia appendiculata]